MQAFFTPQFYALLRQGVAFVERNVPEPRPSLDLLTAVFRMPGLALAFAEYLAAIEAKNALRKPRQYKTTMEYRWFNVPLQEAELHLLAEIGKLHGRAPATRMKRWRIAGR